MLEEYFRNTGSTIENLKHFWQKYALIKCLQFNDNHIFFLKKQYKIKKIFVLPENFPSSQRAGPQIPTMGLWPLPCCSGGKSDLWVTDRDRLCFQNSQQYQNFCSRKTASTCGPDAAHRPWNFSLFFSMVQAHNFIVGSELKMSN